MTGPEAPHHPVPRDEPGLFAGAPGPDERMGDGPSDGGRIRLDRDTPDLVAVSWGDQISSFQVR